MLGRLREGFSGVRRRLAAIGSGFVDTFLRDNKVLPPALALLALLVFAWVVAGVFLGGSGNEQVSNPANVAQSGNSPNAESTAPQAQNGNAESYAAYQSKDPFRQLFSQAGETTAPTSVTTPETTIPETTIPGTTTGNQPPRGGGQNSTGGTRGGGRSATAGPGGGGRNATGGAAGRLFNSGGNLSPP